MARATPEADVARYLVLSRTAVRLRAGLAFWLYPLELAVLLRLPNDPGGLGVQQPLSANDDRSERCG